MKIQELTQHLPDCTFFAFHNGVKKVYWENKEKESKWTDFSKFPKDVINAINESNLVCANLTQEGWLCIFYYIEGDSEWQDAFISDELKDDSELYL